MKKKPTYDELQQRLAAMEARVASLTRNEGHFRALFDSAPNPICLEQTDGRILQANQAMCDLFGYTKDELLSKSFNELIHPDDVELWCQKHETILNGEASTCQVEKRYLKKGGEILWCIGSLSLSDHAQSLSSYFIVQIQNITHIKRLEEQLLHAQKMKAIGTLAGGIAHDFNNLLMAMQGRVSLMIMDVSESEYQYNHLKKMEEHIRRAANLTNQLLGFARGGQYELLETDLTALIQKEVEMFARTRKDIIIYQHYSDPPCLARIDRSQIRQVLINIFINATQAMPDGGTLDIKTKTIRLEQHDNKPIEISPGNYVCITIKDTGVGMDPGTCQRIFEPFFTTRTMGQGAGLGLAAAYGIIRHHGGFINVTSKSGHGTTMSVYLPSAKQQAIETAPPSEMITGHGLILLIDDESIIIDIGQQMIERLGYEVLAATNGEDAIRIYSENKEKIDIVILDLIMPGMGGDETFESLIRENPEIKIIISSGYSVDGKASQLLADGAVGFIQKPFSMNELSETLQRVIGATK